MRVHVSASIKYWKRLFLVLETVVVVAFSFCLLAGSFWGLRVEPRSQVWSAVFAVAIMLAWLFLLIVSPFFLPSLRGVALAGWIIAFGIFVISMLTPALWMLPPGTALEPTAAAPSISGTLSNSKAGDDSTSASSSDSSAFGR